ncbi:type III secretion protein [Pseudomonas sp. WS 5079]|uniref:type III secretion protein n=2 Tax=unclassified Pseudomonas TaxID=196821 RepID=UPI001552BD3A|nr:type III secretion protein [Pseudomonas sp. WS 5079]NMX63337.1 type III secretion protein [Pseudomonas sp. WS 5079]
MSNLAWVQWWATPWMYSREDWRAADEHPALNGLYRSRHSWVGKIYGIAPCLPPPPQPTLLQLALASPDQLDLVLALVDSTCRPSHASLLNESLLQWCNRLSKALPADMLLPDDDPLQLLRTWVSPPTWQRIRLRFSRRRVLELEKNALSLGDSYSRLDTLWHAVVWRIATINSDGKAPYAKDHGD